MPLKILKTTTSRQIFLKFDTLKFTSENEEKCYLTPLRRENLWKFLFFDTTQVTLPKCPCIFIGHMYIASLSIGIK